MDPRPAASQTLMELAERVSQLSLRLESLDVRGEQRHAELGATLGTALRALELIHDDDPGTRRRLGELRASASYEPAFTEPDPLVSIIIPTWDRVDALIDRAVASALAQTHPNVEVIVVGDASPPEIEQAITTLGEPRVRFQNLTIRGPYDEDPYHAWLASGTPGFNAGVAMARGLWIAPLGDDDEFEPHHVERLLEEARGRRLEFVYGRGRVPLPDGSEASVGEFPPRITQIGVQFAVYHAGLRFMELELGHALFGTPNDWGLVRRMMRVGVRMGMVDEATVIFRPSGREPAAAGEDHPRSPGDKHDSIIDLYSPAPPSSGRVPELERQLDDERGLTADLYRRLDDVRRSKSWRLTAPLRRLRGGW